MNACPAWRIRIGLALVLLLALALEGNAVVPEDWTPPPGDFVWRPALATSGPLVVVVSLPLQQAHVYRNGVRIGASTISSGKPGHETPLGVFTILQKRAEHYSNLYDNAPMPWMQRLTWGGVALHAGRLPGHPASHGCIRLPERFARVLFAATRIGDVVMVTDARSAPGVVGRGDVVTPGGAGRAGSGDFWSPDRVRSGPIAVVISTADRRVVVNRNGHRIGQATIEAQPGSMVGTRAYVLLEGNAAEAGAAAADRVSRRWMALEVGTPAADASLRAAFESHRISIPRAFAQQVEALLRAGDTVVITDAPLEGRLHHEQLELESGER